MKLEQLTSNEEMRHVPPTEVLLRRLDDVLRRAIDEVQATLRTVPPEVSRRAEDHVKRASVALGRVAELARHQRGVQSPPNPEGRPIVQALEGAVVNLRNTDSGTFRRRTPFHHFERSRCEMLYAAVLCAESAVTSAIRVLGEADAGIHHRMSMRHPLTKAISFPPAIPK